MVGGTASDPSSGIPSSGLNKVWYHVGNLKDDEGSKTHEQRIAIYEDAPWIDTNLEAFPPAAGWVGNLYGWSYTYNFNYLGEGKTQMI